MKKTLYLIIALFLSSAPLFAQDTTSTGTFTISGYVDTYYQYNFNNPGSRLVQGRIFDVNHNSFALGLVQTMFSYSYGKAKAVLDLTYGPNADLGNFGNDGTAKIIKQAYLSYDLSSKLNFTIGQFGTHIGYELIDAPLNFNYSLSYLFGNGPFYHTGAKLNYSVSDNFGVMVGLLNGWDGLVDFNDKKSVAAQVFVSPAEGFNIYLNWIGGDEYGTLSAFGNKAGSYTSLFDLTTSIAATDKLNIGLNAAFGSFSTGYSSEITDEQIASAPEEQQEILLGDQGRYDKDATWYGAALYANYAISDAFSLGLRAEHFNDKEGVRYFGKAEVNALTLTGNISLADGRFLVKPEFRIDSAKDNFFPDSDGALTKTQATLGSAFILKF